MTSLSGLAASPELRRFIAESNRIEGIDREPTSSEVEAAQTFLGSPIVTLQGVVTVVGVFQPCARLRDVRGLNVRVGGHVAPPGGAAIRAGLVAIIGDAEDGRTTPYETHVAYEKLHPFTDGNGRSGRLLWLWQHTQNGTNGIVLRRGFLHSWYYESLDASR